MSNILALLGEVHQLATVFMAASSSAGAASAPDAKAKRAFSAATRFYHKLELAEAVARYDESLASAPGWKTAAGFRAMCRWSRCEPSRSAQVRSSSTA